MLAWFKIGLRNLIKNGRRSLITALAIAVGFAAVNLFGGFAQYMHTSNRQVAIYVSTQGHLTLFKRGFLEQGRLDPAEYLFSATELQTIEKPPAFRQCAALVSVPRMLTTVLRALLRA